MNNHHKLYAGQFLPWIPGADVTTKVMFQDTMFPGSRSINEFLTKMMKG
jgi:hypothetical protein